MTITDDARLPDVKQIAQIRPDFQYRFDTVIASAAILMGVRSMKCYIGLLNQYLNDSFSELYEVKSVMSFSETI